jgi:hypothetical protein
MRQEVELFQWDEENIETEKKEKPRVKKTKTKHKFFRANSELHLSETLIDFEPEENNSYHFLSCGDIDSFSFFRFMTKLQKIKYFLFSTWCMASDDVQELQKLIDNQRIKRFDAYVGEIFPNSYSKQYQELKETLIKVNGRLAVFRNHSKIYVGYGEKFNFVIESSANINTNPRTENTTIIINTELANFYKDYFDNIVSFQKEECFKDWKKYG